MELGCCTQNIFGSCCATRAVAVLMLFVTTMMLWLKAGFQRNATKVLAYNLTQAHCVRCVKFYASTLRCVTLETGLKDIVLCIINKSAV